MSDKFRFNYIKRLFSLDGDNKYITPELD